MIVKAYFDGRVFVPDGPVDLPAGQEVSLAVEPRPDTMPAASTPLLELIDRIAQLPSDPQWPDDASARHDHYLYGAPRRTPGEILAEIAALPARGGKAGTSHFYPR